MSPLCCSNCSQLSPLSLRSPLPAPHLLPGIYSLLAPGVKQAGPGLLLSFLLGAISCVFTALCYSEFASRIPVAGSAYTYGYVAMGELTGWFIGWNLTLEYAISSAAVARGWGGYVNTLLDSFGAHPPKVRVAVVVLGGVDSIPASLVSLPPRSGSACTLATSVAA